MDRIHKKCEFCSNLVWSPRDPYLEWNSQISCEFGPLRVKWWYMFSSIKMEEYMESELSGIFQVKLVTKTIVRGSPGTQFMHMRVNQVELASNLSFTQGILVWLNDISNRFHKTWIIWLVTEDWSVLYDWRCSWDFYNCPRH